MVSLHLTSLDGSFDITVGTSLFPNNKLSGEQFTIVKLQGVTNSDISRGFYFREGLTYNLQEFKVFTTTEALKLEMLDSNDNTTIEIQDDSEGSYTY